MGGERVEVEERGERRRLRKAKIGRLVTMHSSTICRHFFSQMSLIFSAHYCQLFSLIFVLTQNTQTEIYASI